MLLLLIPECVKKELFHFIYAIVASKKLFQIIRLYLEKKNSGILGFIVGVYSFSTSLSPYIVIPCALSASAVTPSPSVRRWEKVPS